MNELEVRQHRKNTLALALLYTHLGVRAALRSGTSEDLRTARELMEGIIQDVGECVPRDVASDFHGLMGTARKLVELAGGLARAEVRA